MSFEINNTETADNIEVKFMVSHLKPALFIFYFLLNLTIQAQTEKTIDPQYYLEVLHKKNGIDLEKPPPAIKDLKKTSGWNFSIGDKKNWWAANLFTGTYYQTATTCRGIGNYCYIFVEDTEWGRRVDQSSIDNIINAFEKSTPANINKGIYQNNIEAFGNPPDVDNDPRIIICVLNIKDNYSLNNAYIAGYFDSANQFNFATSNNCEIYYMDCDPGNLMNPSSFRNISSTMAHEFQHMIMFNYHGIINAGVQWTFFNEGSSLAAELINGYPIYEQNALFNVNTNRSLLIWNPNNNLNDALYDYSRAARFFLYLKEQFGVSIFKHFNQAPVTGIDGFNQYALPAVGTSRRFSDIVEDWYIANYLNDRSVNSRWGYSSENSFSNVSPTVIKTEPNVASATNSVYKSAAQYITYTSGKNLNITFSNITNPAIRIKVIKVGKGGKRVEDLPVNGTGTYPDFGEDYSTLTFVVYHNNQSDNIGPFRYDYSSTGTSASAGTFAKITDMSINRQNFGLTVLNNFEVLLSGGVEMKGEPPGMTQHNTYSSEIFNQETLTFSSIPAQMVNTHGTQATKLFSGKVFLIGGQRKEELYNPVQKRFEELPQPYSRDFNIGGDAQLLPDGDVLILGGKGYFVSGNPADDSLRLTKNYIYSTVNNTLQLTGDFINVGSGYSSVLLPSGDVLITGGQIDTWYFNGNYWTTRTIWLDNAEIYNRAEKRFITTGKMISKRSGHTSTLLPNGKVLIAGGFYGNAMTQIAEIYDPETKVFTRTGDLNTGRYGHRAVLLANGNVLIIGGDKGNGNPTKINEIYDVNSNTFTITSLLSDVRAFPQAATLANGNVLVASGFIDCNGSTVRNAELFTPSDNRYSPPESPQLFLPADNGADQNSKLLFSWNVTPGSVYYRLQISGTEDFSQIVVDTTEIPIIGIEIKNLPSGNKLYWRVKAVNSNGESSWSAVRSFTTKNEIPGMVGLSFPKNNSANNNSDLELKWDLQLNRTYHIEVAKDLAFNQIIINDSLVEKSFYRTSLLMEGTKYYWRVRAKNILGYGSWSNTWNFTTGISAPSNLSIQRSGLKELKLSWVNNSNNCDGFIIERKISSSSGFIVIGTVPASTLIYYDNNVEQGISYTYRVKGFTSAAESSYSGEIIFFLVGVEEELIPDDFSISQNYPNPFNPTTTINFSLPKESKVFFTVYDILGHTLYQLINETKTAGKHRISWNASSYTSSIYFYRIEAIPTDGSKPFTQVRKMILIK